MNLKTELLAAARALDQAAIPYAVCGGLAVVLHGFPRLTRDLDFLVQESDLEPAKEALGKTGFTIPGGLIPFDIGKEHERRIFRLSKRIGAELLTVDLLLVPDFLQDVWDDREVYEVEGVPIQVVSRKGLLKMKRIAGRPQDLSDIDSLERGEDET